MAVDKTTKKREFKRFYKMLDCTCRFGGIEKVKVSTFLGRNPFLGGIISPPPLK